MKISLNAIKLLGYEELFKLPIDELAGKIGAQLGALEEAPFYLGGLYEAAIVAKVVDCQKHPKADKLSLCLIDDGGAVKGVERDKDGHIQVICGAPNVRQGLTVAWLPPGSLVPASVGKEEFKLSVREIRGHKSNGMLASPAELAISDNHSGILEIIAEEVGKALTKPGTPFKQLYGLDDYILEVENKMFTHRPDCFGLLGVAREIAGIQHKPFKSPDWYRTDAAIANSAQELPLTVKNELPELVPRFVAVPMSQVNVGPSPIWLQSWLTRLGLRPINNVVDLTNYHMLLTGQPLHAYDYDKLKALSNGQAAIVVRQPKKGEKLTLLNGKEIEPRHESIMIATDKQVIGLGGVMGGAETEVDASTKNIVLECANFDMYSIRRTSMAHGLLTDASSRFNKGQSLLQNMAVVCRAAESLQELAGAKVAGRVIDAHKKLPQNQAIEVRVDFINQRLGLSLTQKQIISLLQNVEFDVREAPDGICLKAPFWRTDIEIPEDIVEEVGRLYGYDHLPLDLPPRDVSPTRKDPLLALKAAVRDRLSAAGANEVLTYSFVHADLLKKTEQGTDKAFKLSNALSPDLQYYRLTLIPSLLDKVHSNIKAGYEEFALFELGKSHTLYHQDDDDGVPTEFEFTGLVYAAADKLKKPHAAYYEARKYLDWLVGLPLEFKPVDAAMQQFPVTRPYDPERSALVSLKGGEFLGIIGEFKASVRRSLKLPVHTAGFEVDTTVLSAAIARQSYQPLPRFPKVTQDISLKAKTGLSYQELYSLLVTELDAARPQQTVAELQPLDIYQSASGDKHLAFRLTIASYEHTLTDAAVNKLLDGLAAAAKEAYGAERL